jgi:Zn-dependent hydrolases, including glyoxylases
MHPEIQGFFDPATSTVSYVVHAAGSVECAIIDPVLDYNAAAGRISTVSADAIAAFVQAEGLKVQWLLETHAHADHLSASAYLKRKLGGQIGIGAAITQVQGCSAISITLSRNSSLMARSSIACSSPTSCFISGD